MEAECMHEVDTPYRPADRRKERRGGREELIGKDDLEKGDGAACDEHRSQSDEDRPCSSRYSIRKAFDAAK